MVNKRFWKFLLSSSSNCKRFSWVYPVCLFPISKEGVSGRLHSYYFNHRAMYLPKVISRASEGVYRKRYLQYQSFLGRIRCWFIEDVFSQAVICVDSSWSFVERETGKGRFRQLLEVIWCSISTPAMPEEYYKFELYHKEGWAERRNYLFRYEMKNVLYKAIYRLDCGKIAPVTNKVKFEKYCINEGIPTAGIYAHIRGGKLKVINESALEVKKDLFIKPVSGKGGRGAERIEFQADSGTYALSKSGKSESLSDIFSAYKRQSKKSRFKDGFIVQPKVENHSDLLQLAGKAVATCRVVTIINEGGEPECVVSVFRIPGRLEGVVDNSHAGGLASSVDMRDGTLGPATYLGTNGALEKYYSHPENGARIEGLKLPYWKECLEICNASHSKMSSRVIVGWDIAITNSGPVVIEANAQPCTDIIQRRTRAPLGTHRFGELILFHLNESARTH